MAEAIGAAAAILQLLQATAEVLEAGYSYVRKVSKAPSEIRSLLSAVSAIDTLLDQLQNLSANNGDGKHVLSLLVRGEHLKSCQETLDEANKAINKCISVEGERIKNASRRLTWPFKEGHIQELLARLERHRKHLTDAVTLDSAAAIRKLQAVTYSIQSNLNQRFEEQDQDKLLSWICPEDGFSDEKYMSAFSKHLAGTGQWLLGSTGFHSLYTSGGLMWLAGPPGSGKTVLSASILKHLQDSKGATDVAIGLFFFDSTSSKNFTRNFLMTVTRQLLEQCPAAMSPVKQLFESKKSDNKRELTNAEYSDLLQKVTNKIGKVFLVIDALDEAKEPDEVVSAIQPTGNQGSGSVRAIIISSRTNLSIESVLRPLATQTVILVNQSTADLKTYINVSVERQISCGKLKLRNPLLAEAIKSQILSRCGGLFLQAKFHLDHVAGMKTDKAIRDALQNLPSALDKTYEKTLMRIKNENPTIRLEIKRMLILLTHALESLTSNMIAEAVAFNPRDDSLDFDSVATSPEDLVDSLGSLVMIDRRQCPAVVSLCHLSVYEYLHSDAIKTSAVAEFGVEYQSAHQYIAKICTSYLGLENFSAPLVYPLVYLIESIGPNCEARLFPRKQYAGSLSARPRRLDRIWIQDQWIDARLENYALLAYAVMHWPDHVKFGWSSASSGTKEDIIPYLHWFLNSGNSSCGKFKSWHEIHNYLCDSLDDCEWQQSPLFFSIILGLDVCFDYLFDRKMDLDSEFPGGWTPLTAAAGGGSIHITRQLLDAGATVDQHANPSEHNNFTALHLASEDGDVKMVRLLLSFGASVNARTETESTPFYRAVRGGSYKVIHLLHQAGSDVNARTWDNFTPLIEAIHRGDLNMVEQLLAWGADPLIEMSSGHNALHIAWGYQDNPILSCLKDHVRKQGRLELLPCCQFTPETIQ